VYHVFCLQDWMVMGVPWILPVGPDGDLTVLISTIRSRSTLNSVANLELLPWHHFRQSRLQSCCAGTLTTSMGC
jgi:hypothetical protein